ncbi:MAG: hypothetical protein GX640_13120 [Fibrobacter sp.]|nr:hypothetical protein [Fibrobacter sp.]
MIGWMYIIGMKKVAVFMPQNLSEFIPALSVVTRKAAESSDSITLVVPDWLESLFRKLCSIQAITYNSIRKNEFNGFDKAYLLTDTFSSTWSCFLAGVPVRRGISSQLRTPFLTDIVSGDFDKHNHILKQFSAVLEVSYSEPHKWQGVQGSVKPHPEYDGLAVLCPGPADCPAKQWRGFKELVELSPHQDMVILGDKEDVSLAKKIAPRLPHRVRNLAGQTTLEEAAAIIAGASVVFANDSGLMQLAGFLGIPIVGIFGSTTSSWNRPLGERVAIASSHLSCVPCFRKKCSSKGYQCLESITAEKILSLASEVYR